MLWYFKVTENGDKGKLLHMVNIHDKEDAQKYPLGEYPHTGQSTLYKQDGVVAPEELAKKYRYAEVTSITVGEDHYVVFESIDQVKATIKDAKKDDLKLVLETLQENGLNMTELQEKVETLSKEVVTLKKSALQQKR